MPVSNRFPMLAILLAGLALAGCGTKQLTIPQEATIIRAEAERNSTAIREMAGTGSREERVRALRAIGRIGRPGDVEIVLSAVNDEDIKIREAAIFALGEMQDADTLATWGGTADERVADRLIELLDKSGEHWERVLAVEALGKIRDPKSTDALRRSLIASQSPEDFTKSNPSLGFVTTLAEVNAAMIALMRMKDEASIARMEKWTSNDDLQVRQTALTAIGRIGGPAARAVCLGHLADDDLASRALALKGLAKSGAPEDVPAIAAAFGDGKASLAVKVEAVRALKELKCDASTRVIDEQLYAVGESAAREGSHWIYEDGMTANLLVELIVAAGESSSDQNVANILSSLRGWENGVGFVANEAYASVLSRMGTPEKYFEYPADFKVRTIPALNHHIRALGALRSAHGEEELSNLLKAPGASEEVKERLRKVQSTIVESLYTSIKSRDVGEAEKFLEPHIISLETYTRITALTLAAAAVDEDTTLSKKLLPYFPHTLYTYAAFDPSVNLAAVEGLTKYDQSDPKVSKALNYALSNRSRHVRMAAMKALGRSTAEDFDQFIYNSEMDSGWNPLSMYAGQKETVESFYERLARRARKRVIMKVTLEHFGAFAIEADPRNAPLTVESFEFLDSLNYFAGTGFQRIVPNFVIQGGDPRQNNEGGPDYLLPCEINSTPFARGVVGMAHAGKDTGGCQFFICLSPQPHLDGGYTAWGSILDPAELDAAIAKSLGEIRNGNDVIDQVTPYEPIKEIEFFEF